MRLAFFSSLAAGSRSERFSAAILPELTRHCEVTRFSGDTDYREGIVEHFLAYYEHDRRNPFDATLFQVEDHPSLSQLISALPITKPAAVLHDLTLSQLKPTFLGESEWSPTEYLIASASHHFVKSLHARAAAGVGEVVSTPVMCASTEQVAFDRRALREAVGLEDEAFVVGYSASDPAHTEQLLATIRSFSGRVFGLALPDPSCSGESRNDYDSKVRGVDLFVALHFDILRDLPQGLFVALSSGVPAVTLDFGAGTELPPQVVPRVRPGRGLELELRLLIERIESSNDWRKELGQRGRSFAEIACDPRLVTNDILAGLFRCRLEIGDASSRYRNSVSNRRHQLYLDVASEVGLDHSDQVVTHG